MHKLFNMGNLEFLNDAWHADMWWDTIFADPFDNIGLGYNGFKDRMSYKDYENYCRAVIELSLEVSPVLWWSFNAKHTPMMGHLAYTLDTGFGVDVKCCTQTFTFGQNRRTDLGNNHRPLWRFSRKDFPLRLYPESIKVPSWRQLNGDPRATEGGKVPGDVFDFPRVTGNSKQRRPWHPTQLNEGLVERCLKLTTPPGGSVLDIFGGTGTTLRVAKKLGLDCTLVELSPEYCSKLLGEHTDLRGVNYV